MPSARRLTVQRLAAALAQGELELSPGAERSEALGVLREIPGIGPWSTELIAMRALGDPDAFPASDLGVRRGASALGIPATLRELSERSERWSPWRAYAVQHLWGATPHAVNDWPPVSRGHPPGATGSGRPACRAPSKLAA